MEFIATRQLFLAARPGELSNCTFAELIEGKYYRDVFHVSVANHKTGRIQQATIAIEKKDQRDFFRYVAVLKRLKPTPILAFPFLSSKKGFVVSKPILKNLQDKV